MSNNIGTSFTPSANGKSGWSTGGIATIVPGLNYTLYNSNGQPKMGGGFASRMPQSILDHDNTDNFARTRFLLRDSWNTSSTSGSSYNKRIITPFRAVNNAGDLLSRQDYSCGGSCQTFQSRPNVKGLRTRFGSISVSCVPSVLYSSTQADGSVPPSACNGKYVYDSSDYIRYLKLQAVNKNYNDISFGGNNYSGAQSAIRAIRRY